MRPLSMMLAICLMAPAVGAAHDDCSKAKCEETRQKIGKVEARMRQGYTRAQGERLAAELRALRAIHSKRCR